MSRVSQDRDKLDIGGRVELEMGLDMKSRRGVEERRVGVPVLW